MGLVSRILGSRPRAEDWTLTNTRLVDYFTGGPTASGARVGGDAALKVSTYWACVRNVAEDVAKLPLILYRRLPDGGRERAADHPLYRILRHKPNGAQTSFRWRQTGQVHIGVRGNAYSYVTRVRGQVRELLPIGPDRMQVEQDRETWNLNYRLDGRPVDARSILHIRGLSLDGVTGVSVARYARESLGLAMAMEEHGARLFGNGALFRGILKHPAKMKDDATAKRVRESWDEAFRGENAHKTALLEAGFDYEKISMTPEDSQFLASREFQALDIARWWRMPPHKVGLLGRATFSNIEHQALEYVTDTLLSWLINWEQELSAALLTLDEQEEYFIEHLVDGLLRGDLASRYKAYKDAILTGFMSRNEARRLENMNPEPELDTFLEPLNMQPAGAEEGSDGDGQ